MWYDEANGLGNGSHKSREPQRGGPISREYGLSGIGAAPLGLESNMCGLQPRATFHLPWADIGLPLWGG